MTSSNCLPSGLAKCQEGAWGTSHPVQYGIFASLVGVYVQSRRARWCQPAANPRPPAAQRLKTPSAFNAAWTSRAQGSAAPPALLKHRCAVRFRAGGGGDALPDRSCLRPVLQDPPAGSAVELGAR